MTNEAQKRIQARKAQIQQRKGELAKRTHTKRPLGIDSLGRPTRNVDLMIKLMPTKTKFDKTQSLVDDNARKRLIKQKEQELASIVEGSLPDRQWVRDSRGFVE